MDKLIHSLLRFTLLWVGGIVFLGSGLAQAQHSIWGSVRHDLNGDATPSDFDVPMAGVVVRLYTDPNGDGDPSDGVLVKVTATDIAGEFYMDGVAGGTYVVEQVDPPGATSTFDSEGDPTDNRIRVEIDGEDVGDLIFLDTGVSLAAIRGSVLLEGPANDGEFGLDDEPIGAVIVRLYVDLDGDGLVGVDDVMIDVTATRLDGRYGFGGLISGNYVVEMANPPGAVNLNDAQGAHDDGVVGVTLGFINETDASFLVSGVEVAALRGQIRLDVDGDGDPLDNDPPLVGVVMLLFTDPNGDGNFFDGYAVSLGVTDMEGNYSFPQLPPGSYVIFKFDPMGGSGTYDPSGSPTDNLIAATLAGVDVTGLDYLIEGASVGTALGSVFEDGPAQDGEFSEDDIGVIGVTVRLWADIDGDGLVTDNDALLGEVISSTGGAIEFPNLVHGYYLSEVVAPSGADSINDTVGSPSDGQIAFELSGSQFGDLLFLLDGIDHANLVGEVRNDLDDDGNPADPDPALPNVTMHLWTDPDGDGDPADGQVIATTVTNGQGQYQFSAVAPGKFVVAAVAPLGASPTYDAQGSPTDGLIAVTLNGVSQTGRDFLFTGAQLATISGAVFNDGPDLPGVFSPDDVPLQAVFMQLYADINGNGIADFGDVLIVTRVTDKFGAFEFQGMPSGKYLVVKVNPPGTSSVLDVEGSPDDSTVAVELEGLDMSGQNFLVSGATFMSIIGHARDDADADGDIGDGDEGLPGVLVRLYVDLYSDGELTDEDPFIDSVMTDGSGMFEFSGLTGGSYLLQADAPRGAVATGDSDGANDGLVRVQLTSGDDLASVFLFDYNPTGYLYDAITGEIVAGGTVQVAGPGDITVWFDGSSGQYAFVTDGTPGTYTLTLIPPPGFVPAPMREVQPGSLDVTALVSDPTALGAGRDHTAPGYLTDGSDLVNPFYLSFEMGEDDPLLINNNLPLIRVDAPSFVYWSQIKPGAGGSPTSNLDGDSHSDLLEYAFDTDPESGVTGAPRYGVVLNTETNQFDAFYTVREQGHADVTVKLKLLGDLSLSPGGWVDAEGAGVSTSNGDGSRTVVFANLESQATFALLTSGFVRFEVGLDADQNGEPEAVGVTEAEGWMRLPLSQQIQSWSHPMATAPILEGMITAVGGSALDVSQALNGTDVATLLSGGAYYVEIVEGDHAGHRLEVVTGSSGGDSLQVDSASSRSTLTSLPGTLQGNRFVLRQHRTLAGEFPPATMKATNNSATADRVMVYNPSKPGFDNYWLLASEGGKWVLEGDLTFTNRGGLVISPQSGVMVQRRDPTLIQSKTGHVRSSPFTFRLSQGQNLLGTPWPVAQSPLNRVMTTAAGFTGTNQPTASDMISVLRTDAEPTAGGYDAYYLLKAGMIEQWVLQGDNTFADRGDEMLFRARRATFMKSIQGKPEHTVEAPWVP